MARQKNALRKHEIAPYKQETEPPKEWFELAKWITTISDESEDDVEDYADYAGDGTKAPDVRGVSRAWSFEGTWDAEDPAQSVIKKLKNEIGEGRLVWHKITDSNNETVTVGLAIATDIIAGSGDADQFEEFGCKLTFKTKPKEAPAG